MWAYYVGRVSEGTVKQDEGVTHYGVKGGLEEMGTVLVTSGQWSGGAAK